MNELTLDEIKQKEIDLMSALTSLETLIKTESIGLEQATMAITRIEEQIDYIIEKKEKLFSGL
ncbi:MAG: hypothetical protein JXA43_02125 [Candidatus Diapherotrites archaeon]|nr:hypothetical protein [Candidatus Diapherotrites archaeon]